VGQRCVGLPVAELVVQQQGPDRCLLPGWLWSDRPAWGCDEVIAEFPQVGISNNGGLLYGMPPVAEANPQGIAGDVNSWLRNPLGDRVRFGRMLASGGAFIAFARSRTRVR
jgi:hypothetical protein